MNEFPINMVYMNPNLCLLEIFYKMVIDDLRSLETLILNEKISNCCFSLFVETIAILIYSYFYILFR